MTGWRLYYDSQCGFCTKWMRRSVRWVERSGTSIAALPLQGDEAAARGYGDVVVLEADRVYYAGDAWLKLLGLAPWYLRGLSLMGFSKPTRRSVAWFYKLVAARRSCEIAPR